MTNKRDKRGISPVIATVLLIAIVVILGFIIFLWARTVIQEDVQKFGEPIKTICDEVSISTIIIGTSLVITNNGDRAPINNIALHLKDSNGDVSIQEYSNPIDLAPGRSTTIQVSQTSGTLVAISPILKGSKGGSEETFICENKFEL